MRKEIFVTFSDAKEPFPALAICAKAGNDLVKKHLLLTVGVFAMPSGQVPETENDLKGEACA